MGALDQVATMQEDYRDLLDREIEAGGPTLEEEAQQGAIKKYGANTIINVTVSLMHRVIQAPGPDPAHLAMAVALLDDLDTLGMKVVYKEWNEG